MPGAYLDTSAVGRVLLGEPDRGAIIDALKRYERHVASRLLGLELRRLALRHGLVRDAERLLGAVAQVPLDESVIAAAESVPPSTVASLDAIHLVTAIRLAQAGLIDVVVTYDAQLAAGCGDHGVDVLTPQP